MSEGGNLKELIDSSNKILENELKSIRDLLERSDRQNRKEHDDFIEMYKNQRKLIDGNREKSIYLQGFFDRLETKYKSNKIFWIAFTALFGFTVSIATYLLTT